MHDDLIQELMLYKFKLGHNAMETIKNVCCAKGKGVINHSTVNRWLKKFCSGYKKFYDLARSGRPKTGFQNCAPNRQTQ